MIGRSAVRRGLLQHNRGVFRYGRKLEVLLDAAGRDGSGQESCAALYRPGEHDLSRGFAEALCDADDHRIIQ